MMNGLNQVDIGEKLRKKDLEISVNLAKNTNMNSKKMKKTLVQHFLESKSFQDLISLHAVYPTFSKCKRKVSLNYDQLEAKDSDPIVKECRGIIFKKSDSSTFSEDLSICPQQLDIVAFPMTRFFNYGQTEAAAIDFSNFSIFEKMDGTLIILYYCPISKEWHTATRSVPEADIIMNDSKLTFRSLFEKAVEKSLNTSFDLFTKDLNKNYTYCFELTSPYNPVYVTYKEFGVTLLAVRDNVSFSEIDISNFSFCPKPKQYFISTISEIVEFVNSLNPSEHEGVVLMDSSFNRIKIKNDDYKHLSRLKSSILSSDRNIIKLILSGNEDDVVNLPEDVKSKVSFYKEQIVKLIDDNNKVFLELKSQSPSRKHFAYEVNKITANERKIWKDAMFVMYTKDCDMKTFVDLNKGSPEIKTSFVDKILEYVGSYPSLL